MREPLPIVITTINPLTRAVAGFAGLDSAQVIVVADRKTPHYDDTSAVEFLSLDDQLESGFALSELVPFDHYCRKNLGYLFAMRTGASMIAESDDDNIPYDEWQRSFSVGSNVEASIVSGHRIVNAYRYFTDELIWPRGLPLVSISDNALPKPYHDTATLMIWQGLADLDPDVDAIYRLVFDRTDIEFDSRREPIVLDRGSYCPFNSQNTVWHESAFLYMYLPMFVSFRFTDILRGYVAQRGIWELGGRLAFGNASVYQERNAHNLMKDFKDELDCYTRVEDVVDTLDDCELSGDATKDIVVMYRALHRIGVVDERELAALDAWIRDYLAVTGPRS